jgi:hypothetical protein
MGLNIAGKDGFDMEGAIGEIHCGRLVHKYWRLNYPLEPLEGNVTVATIATEIRTSVMATALGICCLRP